MTSWTTPATWAAATLTAAQLNQQLRDDATNLDERLALHGILSSTRRAQVRSARCGARATATGGQNVPTGTETALTWDTEAWDSDGLHSTSSNTNRLTIPAGMGGVWLACATVQWSDPNPADLTLSVRDGAGTTLARTRTRWDGPSGANRYVTLTAPVVLAPAAWVEVTVTHAIGFSLSVLKSSAGCGFSLVRLFST